jgi:hypothetical protein
MSNHALEKFLAPYYASVGDKAKAAAIRNYAKAVGHAMPAPAPAGNKKKTEPAKKP